MTLTLRARLAVGSTVLFGLLLAALSLISYRVLERMLDTDLTARLTELTRGLHGYLHVADDGPSLVFDVSDSDQAAFVHDATRYYQVYDVATGQLLVASPGLAPLGLDLTPGEVRGFTAQPRPFDIATEYGRFRVSNSIGTGAHARDYLLQVAVPLAPLDGALGRYRALLIWSLVPSLIVAGLAGWWLSGLALRPLAQVAAAADAIDVNTLGERLPVRGTQDELDQVAEAFNETLARLDEAVGEMRQFSAALAHELRTPLTALRGEIELALRRTPDDGVQQRAFASQIEEIDRLTRLIGQILTLARAEAGQIHLSFTPVDLAALTASLVEQLEPVAQSRGVALRYERGASAVVNGDAGWLERLLLNLLDNALKFTAGDGWVRVTVTRERRLARLVVADNGIGLSADDVPRVFDRFFRADRSRSPAATGAGLGLSLVRWIADRHEGSVAVQSRPGAGSIFTVTLPLATEDTIVSERATDGTPGRRPHEVAHRGSTSRA